MDSRFKSALAVVVAVLATAPSWANGDFDDLLKRIPADANCIVCCDVEAVQKSPLGSSAAWQERRRQTYGANMASLPPSLQKLVVAGHMDPSTLGHGWHVAVAKLGNNMTTEKLAKLESGTIDTLDGRDIVLGPRSAYYTVFEPQIVGMRRPANRQETGRWLRSVKNNDKPVISRYLQVGAGRVSPKVQFVMAIDLTDVFDMIGLKTKLANTRTMSSSKSDIDGMARLISGMQGLMLSVGIGDSMNGEIRLDFNNDVRPYAQYMKQLVIEVLDNIGAHLEELTEWNVAQTDTTVILTGKVSMDMAQLIQSAVLRPSAVIRSEPVQPPSGGEIVTDPKAVAAIASARYFAHLREQLELLKNCKARSFKQLGYWYWKGAEQIDDLPILNVDPELLQFGVQVSATLKGMSNLAQQTNSYIKVAEMNAVTQLTTVPVNYSYSAYGPYGGVGWGYTVPGVAVADNTGTISNLIARNSASEGAIRTDTWKNIDTATSLIRQKMTSKYGVEFR